jgi:hypothetical protein
MVDLLDLNDDDRLSYYYVSFWFKTYRTTLDLFGEILSLHIVVLKDEITQIDESRAIDEADPSTRRRRIHK